MTHNDARRVYVITYSRADMDIFPERQLFAEACVAALEDGKCTVEKYACSLELHEDGEPHYHMAVKLSLPKRWKSARDILDKDYNAKVNFKQRQDGNFYNHAFRYVCKEDTEALKYGSAANELIGSPRTKKSVKALAEKGRRKRLAKERSVPSEEEAGPSSVNSSKRPRLSHLDVGKFAVANNVKTEKEFCSLASERDRDGNSDLSNYYMNNSKKVQDMLDAAWKLHLAQPEGGNVSISRIERIQNCAGEPCTPGCDGRWISLALDTLRKNNLNQQTFTSALFELLEKGRGKHRNVMLVGPFDCGKSFLLKPLTKVFPNAFKNPSSTRFAWIGADTADVIFLNDYRWKQEQISWSDLLRLLEEDEVCHLPAPMNHFAREITVDSDVPIFATSESEIRLFSRSGEVVRRETDMMRARWKVFQFFYSIPLEDQIKVPACAACFSKLVLIGDNEQP